MASNPYLRNGNVLSRTTTTTDTSATQPSSARPSSCSAVNTSPKSASVFPHRILLPTRYTHLEPARPLSAFDDDPLFDARAAASLLRVSAECLKKWRRRGQGPDYIQYGEDGAIRYALSALMKFRAEHTVHIGER